LVTASPSGTHAKADALLLRPSDSFTIAGCAFSLPIGPHPCMTVQWLTHCLQLKHDGDFVLDESSVGLCLAGDQAPQGAVMVAATQAVASGL
jgi:hypothetical protein